jgi:hypothetical protein
LKRIRYMLLVRLLAGLVGAVETLDAAAPAAFARADPRLRERWR